MQLSFHCAIWILLIQQSLLADKGMVEPYDHEIKPVLRSRCYSCHGALKQEAGLRLDTVAFMRQGGDSGTILSASPASESLILQRISAEDTSQRMPPEGAPLTAQQITQIRRWVEHGAAGPVDEQPEEDPDKHWAFQAPVRPPLPAVSGDELSTVNIIDAFINDRLHRNHLQPQSAADLSVQFRRVYLDLVGMPPTRDELLAFLADKSPAAWQTVVDRLLNDDRYGERWGRHWMDIWRYSDWYGRRHVPDVWNSAPQIWRWRDWIVQSLNADLGYDEMVQQMLAGDEVAPENDAAGYATGFLIRNWYALNPNDWMRANVEHTGKAFLGLTFNCAHCHDHKYDPILQDDYFRLRAFFEPIYVRQEQVPGEADPGPFQDYVYSGPLRKVIRLGAVRVFDKQPDAPTWFYSGGDERNREEQRGSYTPGVPKVLASGEMTVRPVQLPLTAWYPGMRPTIIKSLIDEQEAVIAKARLELQQVPPESAHPIVLLHQRLEDSKQAFSVAFREAAQSGNAPVIAGQQALLMDATTGRRILFNTLPGLESLPENSVVGLKIRLLTDTHFNFQLAKDAVKGLTAGYVAFAAGKILSYQPGSFREFQAGAYSYSDGQSQFDIQLQIQHASDQCLLTVTCKDDHKLLVDHLPVALNAWNPIGDPTKAIFLDARPGSVVLVDDITISAPMADLSGAVKGSVDSDAADLFRISFESPEYSIDADVIGFAGWDVSPIGMAPATSQVTNHAGNAALRQLSLDVQAAHRALETAQAGRRRFEVQIAAATAAINSIKAREAAERSKYASQTDGSPSDEYTRLAKAASRAERDTNVLQAESTVLTCTVALASAEALPEDHADRAKQIETHTRQLSESKQSLRTAVEAARDESLNGRYSGFGPTYPQTSSGRRRALAEWITYRQNPLTARVAINHIWTRHFHSPLVATVTDFGRNGARPTHPDLLDWLAVELMENAWSMKHIHRIILTSDVYRRSSSSRSCLHQVEADPQNRLLWRMNTGRMEAEVVRDSMLYCADKLDLTQGGQELENDQALTTFRRSLYYSCNPENDGKSELSKLFDAPEPGDCYRRSNTIIPQQALALTNSQLVHDLSSTLAAAVLRELPETELRTDADMGICIQHLFLRILSREATNTEINICLSAYRDQLKTGLPKDVKDQAETEACRDNPRSLNALSSIARALLNHNDFITIR